MSILAAILSVVVGRGEGHDVEIGFKIMFMLHLGQAQISLHSQTVTALRGVPGNMSRKPADTVMEWDNFIWDTLYIYVDVTNSQQR